MIFVFLSDKHFAIFVLCVVHRVIFLLNLFAVLVNYTNSLSQACFDI